MKASTILMIKSVVSVIAGVLMVAIPAQLTSIFGMQMTSAGLMMCQVLGGFYIGTGIVCWTTRDATQTVAGRGVVSAFIVQDAIATVMLLIGQLNGLTNALGWIVVAIYAALALALAYVRFASLEPRPRAATPAGGM